jgi:hypothetical protein
LAGLLSKELRIKINSALHPETQDKRQEYDKWLKKKSELLEEIKKMEHQLNELKVQLKQTIKHIEWKQLDKKEKFFKPSLPKVVPRVVP